MIPRKQVRRLYAVRASSRKQTTNLNVNSPAPEVYTTALTKKQANKIAKDYSKSYHTVKIRDITRG